MCYLYSSPKSIRVDALALKDSEIFGMAVHYYDEDDIAVEDDNPSISSVVVNHHIELTDEEKKSKARQRALHRYQNEQYQQLTKRAKARTAKQAKQ